MDLCRDKVVWGKLRFLFYQCLPETWDSPLYPGFAAVFREAGIGQAHVEEGRKHEGEEGDRGPAHQVQDGAEAAHARTQGRLFLKTKTKPNRYFFNRPKPNQAGSFFKTPNQTKLGDENVLNIFKKGKATRTVRRKMTCNFWNYHKITLDYLIRLFLQGCGSALI